MQYLEMSEEGSVIKENYRIRLIENSNEKGVFVLELLPRTSRIGKRIAKIRVWVDSQTWFLTRMDIWEPNGDYSIIKLKDAKLNVPIQDSVYDFRPPPGTAINEPLKTSPSRSER
jgi:outer membrane lipoprotein-sorting protein